MYLWSFQILLEFQKWVKSPESARWPSMEEILTRDLRCRVFRASTGKHICFFNTAVKAYLLDHYGNDYFLPMTRDILSRGKLTEVKPFVFTMFCCMLRLKVKHCQGMPHTHTHTHAHTHTQRHTYIFTSI